MWPTAPTSCAWRTSRNVTPGKYDYRPKQSFIAGLPSWLKACAVKWWFSGAVFYFIGWGFFVQSADQLDLTFVLGLALGLTTDLLINRVLVFFESDRQSYRGYIFSYSRRFFSVPVNLVYGVVLSAAVSYTYHFINVAALRVTGAPPGTVTLGAEPMLYGLFFTGFDMALVGLKRLVVWAVKRGRSE